MKTLNLVDLEKSNIKYKILPFPDGQQDIVIDENDCYSSQYGYLLMSHKDCIVQIKSRFNSFKDLELIVCATKALRKLGVKEIHLYIPYLLGARSDRQFVEGGTSYLVDVIAPIINSLEFETVTVIDVHSDVAAACIKNLKVKSNSEIVQWSLVEIKKDSYIKNKEKAVNYLDNCILISPDAGSLKKIYKVADTISYKGDIITCSKYRDVEGKLSRINVPLEIDSHYKKDFIIIDDICDGGQTFINIANNIKTWSNHHEIKPKIYLIVTHGIFSKGFEELSKYFDGIYCTNSYGTILAEDAKELKQASIVKQLNVF